MDKNSKQTVVALRLKDGSDILGFYCGECEKTELFEDSIILYRPIYISPHSNVINGVTLYTYSSSLYFRFGSQMIHMPYSNILHHDIASDFFTQLFFENIVDLMSHEDIINDAHSKFYERRAVKDAMKDTDSILLAASSVIQ